MNFIQWIPQKERKWVVLSFAWAILLCIYGVWKLPQLGTDRFHRHQLKEAFTNYGSFAEFLLFFVLAYFILTFILKKGFLKHWVWARKSVASLTRITRKWHTPIALISLSLIVLHVIGAFVYGFRFNFSYVSGLVTLIVLLPVPIAGILRYKKLDRKWHLRLSITFAVLFLVHIYL